MPTADGPEGEPRPQEIGTAGLRKVGPGKQTRKRHNSHRTEGPPGEEEEEPGGEMGSPRLGGPDASLQFQGNRPIAPFVGEISRDSTTKKGGGPVDEDRRPRWATGPTTASAGCQPVRTALRPACQPSRPAEGPPLSALRGLVSPPDRSRCTPLRLANPKALLMISGHEAWLRGWRGRWRSILESRRGSNLGRTLLVGSTVGCGSRRRLLALISLPSARLGVDSQRKSGDGV